MNKTLLYCSVSNTSFCKGVFLLRLSKLNSRNEISIFRIVVPYRSVAGYSCDT